MCLDSFNGLVVVEWPPPFTTSGHLLDVPPGVLGHLTGEIDYLLRLDLRQLEFVVLRGAPIYMLETEVGMIGGTVKWQRRSFRCVAGRGRFPRPGDAISSQGESSTPRPVPNPALGRPQRPPQCSAPRSDRPW